MAFNLPVLSWKPRLVSRAKRARPVLAEMAPPTLTSNPEVTVERIPAEKKKIYHYVYEDGTSVDQVVEYTDTDLLFIAKINKAAEV